MSIKDKIISDYSGKINELCSLCESPIEEKMLLHLFNFINGNRDDGMKSFGDIEFIIDEIDPYDEELKKEEKKILLDKIKKLGYRKFYNYERIIGFKSTSASAEWIEYKSLIDGNSNIVVYEIEVLPQTKIYCANKNYRTDIAIYLNRYKSDLLFNKGEFIERKGIVLECDGHDYHKTQTQRTSDNIRERNFKSIGWQVLRYTGSEINGFTINNFKKYFDQIIKILYSRFN